MTSVSNGITELEHSLLISYVFRASVWRFTLPPMIRREFLSGLRQPMLFQHHYPSLLENVQFLYCQEPIVLLDSFQVGFKTLIR